MPIRINAATTDDLPEIVGSVDALFATDARAHNAAATNLRWASESGMAYCRSLLADSDNLILLARDDDEAAGHLVGRLRGPDSLHLIRVADLESIHVYPAHRSRGAGEQLVTAFLAWAADKGAHLATVTAYAANEGARRFYARYGFAVRSVTFGVDLPREPAATRSP